MSQRIVPFIGYEDAAGAIEWLQRAFGFREERDQRYEEGGRISHAELRLDSATIYIATPDGYGRLCLPGEPALSLIVPCGKPHLLRGRCCVAKGSGLDGRASPPLPQAVRT